MEHVKNLLLGAISIAGSIIINALGGWDMTLQLLLGMMAADYATGVAVAAFWKRSNKSASGALNSRAGFKGLCRKGAILALVWIAAMLDKALGVDYARTTVCIFFIGNEGLSLLENLGLMGVPYPDFLKRMLEVLHDRGNNGNTPSDISGNGRNMR